jgi:DNA-binding LacI/PurR family transcriptional regulator
MDIAYLAGVSQPTVSRALRGSSMVHPDTRKRIEQIARDLNYSVNKSAASLRRQQSNTLALLFFEEPGSDGSHINPFFLAMLESITRACSERGYDLLVSFQKMTDNWHIRYLDSNRADGLILLGYGDYLEYQSHLQSLVQQNTPFVRWGSVSDGGVGTVLGSDNIQGGKMAATELIKTGCKHIAFIGNASSNYPEFNDRYRGFMLAHQDAGIPLGYTRQINALSNEQEGYNATHILLSNTAPLDGIVAASDLIAIGAMRALRERGMTVPEQVGVVGFDDIPAASLTSPSLTTVSQDLTAAGAALVDTLLATIEDELVLSKAYPTHLVIRQSTRSTHI